jgi:solute carrier family 6 GABA transporter-like protein 6/8/11/12/13
MIGYRPNPWLRICWTLVTLLVCAGLCIFMWVTFKPLTYNRSYEYPAWAQGIGLCLALASMLCIPLTALFKLIATQGSLSEVGVHFIGHRMS